MENKKNEKMYCFELFETFPDIVLILDQNMKIEYYNKKATELLMFSPEGGELDTIISDSSFILEKISNLEINQYLNNYEILVKHKEGDQYSYVTASAFLSPKSSEKKYILFIKNMTEIIKEYSNQIKTNIELIDSNEMLKKSYSDIILENRLTLIGQLSAGIAHEINTPLGYFSNNFNYLLESIGSLGEYINYLKKDITHDAEVLEKYRYVEDVFDDLEDIRKETDQGIDRIKKIVDSLGEFSHTNTLGRYDQFNINESINNMLEITGNLYNDGILISFVPGDVDSTFCVVSEINQALLNIFNNAVEASKKSSNEKKIIIETCQKEGWIVISIKNTGPLIKEEDLNNIFNPFFTTKKVGEGMGLGLTIAGYIIKDRHSGHVKVSNLDNGVCFEILLPLVEYINGEL